MKNTNLLNTAVFNQSGVLSEYVPTEEIAFGTYGLQNDEIVVHDIEVMTPDREFATVGVPGGDGMILLEDNWRENGLKLRGTVIGTTRIDAENKIHEMMRHLHVASGTLYLLDGGNYKTFQTTLRNATFDRKGGHITHIPFELEFVGLKSFWQSSAYVSEDYFATTDLSFTESVSNDGSIESQPVFLFSVASATSVTGLSIKNNDTGAQISISEAITAGNVVVFDSENKTVEIDGSEIEFDGTFLELNVGLNSFTITASGTAIEYDLTVKYKNNYLTP